MTPADTACEASSDIELPGLQLHHDFEMELANWEGWEVAAAMLRSLGAEFVSIRVTRRERAILARCRVTGIASAAARAFAGAVPKSCSGRMLGLEHLYLA